MNKTILVVEDEVFHVKLYQAAFDSKGIDIIVSTDGSDALDLAKNHSPDLIIMDIQLPEISGVEYIRELKADDNLKNIPILVVSVHALSGDGEKFLEAGGDEYLSKPVQLPDLFDAVDRMIK